MEDMMGGLIFMGVIGVAIIILVIVYCCIRHELCYCQKNVSTKEQDKGGEPLLDQFYHEHDDDDFQPPSYGKVGDGGQFDVGEFRYVKTDDSDRFTSEEDILSGEGEDILSALPKTYMSVRTRADLDSIGTDSQFDRSEILGTKGMKKDTYIDGVQLKLSLLYSKSDSFLMLTVIEVTGMPGKDAGGYKFIRIAVTLLPEKKYHSKTKVQPVGDDVIAFGDSFKFSNVSRASLFTSAYRFRLYAKNKRSKEVCAGEMFVQLADVAQRSFGFVTTKSFERKKKR